MQIAAGNIRQLTDIEPPCGEAEARGACPAGSRGASATGLACSLALDVDDLPQCVPDLHQVGGIGHDPDDVFAGSGDLVGERVRVPRNSKARARREAPEFHVPGRGTESGQLRARGRLGLPCGR